MAVLLYFKATKLRFRSISHSKGYCRIETHTCNTSISNTLYQLVGYTSGL